MAKAIDMSGKRSGRLQILERAENRGTQAQAYWHCRCDCGTETIVIGRDLRSGRTQSCGCLNRELLHRSVTKHGDCREEKTKLYRAWLGMKKRCYQKSSVSYKNYGARGITVCAEWIDNYPSFKAWAITNFFDDKKNRADQQLDRINNDGPYAPWNCRFATAKVQANNRRIRKYSYV